LGSTPLRLDPPLGERGRETGRHPSLDTATAARAFERRFGYRPRLFRAPARVNLIGEHTDYHEGLVLPLAIERGTLVAAGARDDRLIRVHSESAGTDGLVDLSAPPKPRRGHWLDYVEGTARVLEENGVGVPGADLWIEGDVPVGAGLSSSASLEVALAGALLALSNRREDATRVALWCQAAEHRYVGTQCGIMDQLAVSLGREGHALLIDCRTLTSAPIRFPEGAAVVICDSGVRHSLVFSAYNERRSQGEEALRRLARGRPDRRTLRDVTPDELAREAAVLDETLQARARHVVTEIERTRQAARALAEGDLDRVGRLMAESHRSLRDDYEVSVPELDALVEAASAVPGVFGSRLTGGGFGGCTVSLVAPEAVARLGTALEGALREFGRAPDWFVTRPAAGATEI
jgi:galactokinase